MQFDFDPIEALCIIQKQAEKHDDFNKWYEQLFQKIAKLEGFVTYREDPAVKFQLKEIMAIMTCQEEGLEEGGDPLKDPMYIEKHKRIESES